MSMEALVERLLVVERTYAQECTRWLSQHRQGKDDVGEAAAQRTSSEARKRP